MCLEGLGTTISLLLKGLYTFLPVVLLVGFVCIVLLWDRRCAIVALRA